MRHVRREKVLHPALCGLSLVALVLGASGCGSEGTRMANHTQVAPIIEVLSRSCVPVPPGASAGLLPKCTVILANGQRDRCQVGSAPARPTPEALRSHGCTILSPVMLTPAIRRALAQRDKVARCLHAHGLSSVKGPSAYPDASAAEAADGVLMLAHNGSLAVYPDKKTAERFSSNVEQRREFVERHGVIIVRWPGGVPAAGTSSAISQCTEQ